MRASRSLTFFLALWMAEGWCIEEVDASADEPPPKNEDVGTRGLLVRRVGVLNVPAGSEE